MWKFNWFIYKNKQLFLLFPVCPSQLSWKSVRQFLRIFIFLVVVQSSRCWIWVGIKSTQLIHTTQLKVIFLRTCAWKHLLHGATQSMINGHNLMIKLVTKFICVLPCVMQYPSYKNEFILKLYIFLDIFNHRREIWLDNVNKLSCPFKLFNKITCFWLKSNQLSCLNNKQLLLNCLSTLSAEFGLFARQKSFESVVGSLKEPKMNST